MIALGLILLAAGGFLAWVMREVQGRSVAGVVGILVILVCFVAGWSLTASGVRTARNRRRVRRGRRISRP